MQCRLSGGQLKRVPNVLVETFTRCRLCGKAKSRRGRLPGFRLYGYHFRLLVSGRPNFIVSACMPPLRVFVSVPLPVPLAICVCMSFSRSVRVKYTHDHSELYMLFIAVLFVLFCLMLRYI